MLAEAKTSARSPLTMRSRSSPEAPNSPVTGLPPVCAHAAASSVIAGLQAAGGVQADRLLRLRSGALNRIASDSAARVPGMATDHFFALAKNSCSPPIL